MMKIPPDGLVGRFFPSLIMLESRCNLVHAETTSIMIDSPSRLPCRIRCGKVRELFRPLSKISETMP
jgi:hypothetical protein